MGFKADIIYFLYLLNGTYKQCLISKGDLLSMVAKFRVKYIYNKKEKGKREEKERERRKMCPPPSLTIRKQRGRSALQMEA